MRPERITYLVISSSGPCGHRHRSLQAAVDCLEEHREEDRLTGGRGDWQIVQVGEAQRSAILSGMWSDWPEHLHQVGEFQTGWREFQVLGFRETH